MPLRQRTPEAVDPMAVPDHLRVAYDAIPADVENKIRRELYGSHDIVRTIGGTPTVLQPADNDRDLDLALHLEKIRRAAQVVARDEERRAQTERDKRVHTCKLCQRYDPTACNESVVASTAVPDCYCASCRGEWARQELEQYAATVVDGERISTRIAAARKARTKE